MIKFFIYSLLLLAFVLYGALPAILFFNPHFVSRAVFLNALNNPFQANLCGEFDQFDLHSNTTRCLKIEVGESKIKLGAWHLLPGKSLESFESTTTPDKLFDSGEPVFLYLHGNGFNRGAAHRIQLYKILTEGLNYHVLSLDYRGYGDSDGVPTCEKDVVEDGMGGVEFLQNITQGRSPIYIWGHSLGTGVAASVIRELVSQNKMTGLKGVILETPFDNLRNAGRHHPISKPFNFLPFFDSVFLNSIDKSGIYFKSDENLKHSPVPVLILHAFDDEMIPYDLAKNLFTVLRDAGKEVDFLSFEAGKGYGHRHLWKAKELKNHIDDFVKKTLM